jgi:hypothetical protein
VVIVRGGADAGLEAFAHDAEGQLIREVSPTDVDPSRFVGWFVIAAAAVALLVLALGRYLAPRMGSAFEGNGEGSREHPDDDETDALPREPEGT